MTPKLIRRSSTESLRTRDSAKSSRRSETPASFIDMSGKDGTDSDESSNETTSSDSEGSVLKIRNEVFRDNEDENLELDF